MVFKCQTDSFLKEFTTKIVKIETEDKKLLVHFEVISRAFSSNPFNILLNLIFPRIPFYSRKEEVNQQTMEKSSSSLTTKNRFKFRT